MSKMIFKALYIFSSSEKKAKAVEFSDGKNMVTSNDEDGNERGKSVIMKSLYHAMGADCDFSDMWKEENKTYIVKFAVDGTDYFMFRYQTMFKLFDSNQSLLFTCVNRQELSEKLYDVFRFAAKLPNKATKKLEITPPAFNYILYFIDQNHQDGSKFSSFKNLAQYSNFKEDLLLYHFGAFDETYYANKIRIEELNEAIAKGEKDKELTETMLERIYEGLQSVSYSKDITRLENDVARTKDKYNEIAQKLSSIRQKLIDLRSEKDDLLRELELLSQFEQLNEKNIESLHKKICPTCKLHLDDTLDLQIKHYNVTDDIYLLRSDRMISVNEADREISRQEQYYREWLAKLNEYEQSLNLKSQEVNDVLRHKGFVEIKDKMGDELYEIKQKLGEYDTELKDVKKKIKEYAEKKDAINEKYKQIMLNDTLRFGLEEIEISSLEKITNTFVADGSNRPIATAIWYMNLIRLKNIFAPNSIHFPIVIDSPNNTEADKTKRLKVYQYLCEKADENNQLILSGLGFDQELDDSLSFERIIVLDNAKYELLNSQDYTDNLALFETLNRAMGGITND